MHQEDSLVNLRFHDLRHEATCRLGTKFPNLIELASVTGHREVNMLKRYCNIHPSPSDVFMQSKWSSQWLCERA
ncbi:hypothetical protein [Pseudomonas sp. MH10]|uniref:hypothetical protein n=1 Tax=Pseudomonas sp. MH10 TaxID=3048627 RepID=UPI002AC896DE|nr:hypothetical protein [Pseudomonas sp. MH10]MEB0039503.1 hypothetical protein [Pseudomonas sp. MH10]WPX62437.1 hypothetical protein RHM59_16020 [Pseudomonas sp. MH10]